MLQCGFEINARKLIRVVIGTYFCYKCIVFALAYKAAIKVSEQIHILYSLLFMLSYFEQRSLASRQKASSTLIKEIKEASIWLPDHVMPPLPKQNLLKQTQDVLRLGVSQSHKQRTSNNNSLLKILSPSVSILSVIACWFVSVTNCTQRQCH